jgi:hypothetical protein
VAVGDVQLAVAPTRVIKRRDFAWRITLGGQPTRRPSLHRRAIRPAAEPADEAVIQRECLDAMVAVVGDQEVAVVDQLLRDRRIEATG